VGTSRAQPHPGSHVIPALWYGYHRGGSFQQGVKPVVPFLSRGTLGASGVLLMEASVSPEAEPGRGPGSPLITPIPSPFDVLDREPEARGR
jgi:hypothetical protein